MSRSPSQGDLNAAQSSTANLAVDEQRRKAAEDEKKVKGGTAVPIGGDATQPLLQQRTATGPSNVSKLLGCLVQVPQAIGGTLASGAKWFWYHPAVSMMLLTGSVNGVGFAAVNGKLGTTAEEYSNKALNVVRNDANATMGVVTAATMFGGGLLASAVSRYRADNAAEAERTVGVASRV